MYLLYYTCCRAMVLFKRKIVLYSNPVTCIYCIIRIIRIAGLGLYFNDLLCYIITLAHVFIVLYVLQG